MPSESKSKVNLLLFFLLGILLSACGEGPSTSVNSTPTADFLPTSNANAGPVENGVTSKNVAGAQRAIVRKSIEVNNFILKVAGVEKLGNILVYGGAAERSQANGTWIVIPVDLTNTYTRAEAALATDFELRLGNGQLFQQITDPKILASYAGRRGGKTSEQEIAPGESIRSYLVFDIPAEAVGLNLIFKKATSQPVSLGI